MSTPISMPKGYKALGAFPIDASTLFSSLSALQAHAEGTTSYAGQVCSVVENNVVTVYKVNSDKSLTAIDTTYTHPNHSGDVTSAGDGTTTIGDNKVTNAKLAQVSTSTIKGRATAGTGNVEDLSAAQVRTIINVADGANNYVHPTGDGNLHVPATGTNSNGKVLKAGTGEGSFSWGTLSAADVGALSSLTIGTVTTGNAGSQASASIGGTAPSQSLNLTIPRGADGVLPTGSILTYAEVFNADPNSSIKTPVWGPTLSGTYSRSGLLVTVDTPAAQPHGLSVGNIVKADFLSGGVTNGQFTVLSAPTTTRVTFNHTQSGTASGNVDITRSTGEGGWSAVVDTLATSNYTAGDLSSDVTFNKTLGALTFAAKGATTFYQFVATIGCFKGESGSNGVDIGISIDGANPIPSHYTSIPTAGFTTTQREISVSGVFSLTPGQAHTVRLMVRQTGGGNSSTENSILMRTLNLNINSINAIGAGMGPAGPANTLAIGTVSEGALAASITGLAPNQTLNLTIPPTPQPSNATPQSLGTAFAGTDNNYARADHVHALPAIPAPSSDTPQPLGVAASGSSSNYARADHAHPADFIDAVFIDTSAEESPADGVYYRTEIGELGYPTYEKRSENTETSVYITAVESSSNDNKFWEVGSNDGTVYYRSGPITNTYPWQASGWQGVDAALFVSLTQAKAGRAAKEFIAALTVGGFTQKGPFVELAAVAETGSYEDLTGKPTNFTGSDDTVAGTAGLVPAPAATDNTKFLKGDGTWAAALPDELFVKGGMSATPSTPQQDVEGEYVKMSYFGHPYYLKKNGTHLIMLQIRGDVRYWEITYLPGDEPVYVSSSWPNGTSPLFPTDVAFSDDNGVDTTDYPAPFPKVLNTTHSHNAFSGATSSAPGLPGFVPRPATGDNTKFLKGDGTWADLLVSDIENLQIALDARPTDVSLASEFAERDDRIAEVETALGGKAPAGDFTGSDGTVAGTAGLVPAPVATDNTKFLKGDGTWETISPVVSSYNPFSVNPWPGVTSHAIPNGNRNHVALYTNSTSNDVTANLPTTPQEGDTLTVRYYAGIGDGTLTVAGASQGGVVLQLSESASFVAETFSGTVVWVLVSLTAQADWSEGVFSSPRFIRNKPTNFTGSNGTVAGTSGFVPAPAETDNTKFLKGDGTWADTGGFTIAMAIAL